MSRIKIKHQPHCAIWSEPPGLMSVNDCNCGAVPGVTKIAAGTDEKIAKLEERISALEQKVAALDSRTYGSQVLGG